MLEVYSLYCLTCSDQQLVATAATPMRTAAASLPLQQLSAHLTMAAVLLCGILYRINQVSYCVDFVPFFMISL